MCDLYFQFWLTKRNKLCTESEKTLQRRKSLGVIPALTCVTLLTMSLGSNIYKVHFKHALTSSDLSFSWKDVLSKSTRFARIRQVKTRFQMLYFTEAVETAPRNITQTKKTPIRSIALAIMTEKPKKLELQTLSCVWNPRKSYDQFGSMPVLEEAMTSWFYCSAKNSSGVCQFWKKRWRHDSVVLLKPVREYASFGRSDDVMIHCSRTTSPSGEG